MRWLDQIAAALILLVGVAHVAAASAVFSEPTERRVWFLSAGVFGITAGLANVARARADRASVWLILAALSGSLGTLLLGGLLAAAGSGLGVQAFVTFAVAGVSALFGVRDLVRGRRA